jgi:hypothetical protein
LPRILLKKFGRSVSQPGGEGKGERHASIYFGITGGRDHSDIAPHFHEAHIDQDPQVTRADWYYFRALALYVLQRPAEANSVLELKAGKACLWFHHFPFSFSAAFGSTGETHWHETAFRNVAASLAKITRRS